MTHTALHLKPSTADLGPTDRFEKWIQAPVTHYGFTHVGEEWQIHLTNRSAPSSAGETSANIIPIPITILFQMLAEAEDETLLSDWLAIAEPTFDFWNNDLDAAYDDL